MLQYVDTYHRTGNVIVKCDDVKWIKDSTKNEEGCLNPFSKHTSA